MHWLAVLNLLYLKRNNWAHKRGIPNRGALYMVYPDVVCTMNIVLLILTLISFTISLVTILAYYAPASMKLKSIMDQINSEENSNGPMTRFLRDLSNGNPYNSMFIDLPKSEKYLEQDDISELVHRIRLSRKILKLALGSMILCIVLMLILE